MVLIIGGAYQGKLEYAKAAYTLTDGDIWTCTDTHIDFSRRCVYGLEEFTLACVRAGTDPVAVFQGEKARWANSVLICQDIFCGVVPLGAEMRAWRQSTGALCRYLSGEAARVVRVFCGLEQRLK